MAGASYTIAMIEFPQGYQAATAASPLSAGIKLLPYSLPVSIASALTGLLTDKVKIPPLVVIIAGAALQIVGVALLYASPINTHTPASSYGYEVVAGFGAGLTLTTLLLLAPLMVERTDIGKRQYLLADIMTNCDSYCTRHNYSVSTYRWCCRRRSCYKFIEQPRQIPLGPRTVVRAAQRHSSIFGHH